MLGKNAILLLVILVAVLSGCARPRPLHTEPDLIPPLLESPAPEPAAPARQLKGLGYTTQVGAFAEIGNAVRLQARLEQLGIDAYYFLHESGLYKVRFGNHPSYAAARSEAEGLRARGLIAEFFIVAPEEYAAKRIQLSGSGDLREELVRTALRFIGTPYQWGGTSSEDGFDCSGLTMVTYRLNGLDLPRVSRSQFEAGNFVAKPQLQKGDLVFFATSGGKRVSHVGLYIGDDRFVHAPRRGQTVRVERLSGGYYERTYLGARSYL
ncbi:peptidoglycan-binding protein [Desulfuromonas versatilis]|uniref:Peptidoglycan-binding protein n=1 Tax=Desulfuromonas versatilis TaxID=2802975 RepID=A0ABM8HT11_9BACT|nr:NlpC/P60 family protein [Desulfuromonas versatilis]BCR04147.1 peptidoglycan-binding protein [Desulfuromonas versatilis]